LCSIPPGWGSRRRLPPRLRRWKGLATPDPFALSLSKGRSSLRKKKRCFDRLSTNGGEFSLSYSGLTVPTSRRTLPNSPHADFLPITVSHPSLSNRAPLLRTLAKPPSLAYVRARSTGLLSREDRDRSRRSFNKSFGTVGGHRPARCIPSSQQTVSRMPATASGFAGGSAKRPRDPTRWPEKTPVPAKVGMI
jgi:hypothetical protein